MRHLAQKRPHQLFRILLQLLEHALYAGKTVALHDIEQTRGAGVAGGNLRVQVAFALFRRAHVVEQQAEDVVLHLPAGN